MCYNFFLFIYLNLKQFRSSSHLFENSVCAPHAKFARETALHFNYCPFTHTHIHSHKYSYSFRDHVRFHFSRYYLSPLAFHLQLRRKCQIALLSLYNVMLEMQLIPSNCAHNSIWPHHHRSKHSFRGVFACKFLSALSIQFPIPATL